MPSFSKFAQLAILLGSVVTVSAAPKPIRIVARQAEAAATPTSAAAAVATDPAAAASAAAVAGGLTDTDILQLYVQAYRLWNKN
jgi:hypothetical protein